MSKLIYTPQDGKPFVRQVPDMERPVFYRMDAQRKYVGRMKEYLAALSACHSDPIPLYGDMAVSWEPGQDVSGLVEVEYEVLQLIDKDGKEREWLPAYWKQYSLTHPDVRRIIARMKPDKNTRNEQR